MSQQHSYLKTANHPSFGNSTHNFNVRQKSFEMSTSLTNLKRNSPQHRKHSSSQSSNEEEEQQRRTKHTEISSCSKLNRVNCNRNGKMWRNELDMSDNGTNDSSIPRRKTKTNENVDVNSSSWYISNLIDVGLRVVLVIIFM